MSTMILEKGTLWNRLVATTEHALRSGALVPLHTNAATVDGDSGVRFSVRILSSLRKKDEARIRQSQSASAGKPANPFLPPEPDLTVAQVSDTHIAVLNKFNVNQGALRRYLAQLDGLRRLAVCPQRNAAGKTANRRTDACVARGDGPTNVARLSSQRNEPN